jgi:hypothetical protein
MNRILLKNKRIFQTYSTNTISEVNQGKFCQLKKGTVKFFNPEKNWGFIFTKQGEELFFHVFLIFFQIFRKMKLCVLKLNTLNQVSILFIQF